MPVLRCPRMVGQREVTRLREWIIANLLIIVAVLAVLMTVIAITQAVRINGFRIDLPLVPAFGPKGLIAERDEARALLGQFKAARDQANAAAVAARESEEQALKQLAKGTDDAIEQSRRRAAGSTERFIAAGGVPDHHRCPGGPVAPGTVHGPGSAAPLHHPAELDGAAPLPDLPQAEIVRVTGDDVRICTANTIIAEEARDLLLGLEARTAP
jgi:hypothetical protein